MPNFLGNIRWQSIDHQLHNISKLLIYFLLGIGSICFVFYVSFGIGVVIERAGPPEEFFSGLGKLLGSIFLIFVMGVLSLLYGYANSSPSQKYWIIGLICAIGSLLANFGGNFIELSLDDVALIGIFKAISTGVVFAFAHMYNIQNLEQTYRQVIYAFTLGIIFASLILRLGYLFPAIVLHGVNNSLVVLSNNSLGNPTLRGAVELIGIGIPIILALVCLYVDFIKFPIYKRLNLRLGLISTAKRLGYKSSIERK